MKLRGIRCLLWKMMKKVTKMTKRMMRKKKRGTVNDDEEDEEVDTEESKRTCYLIEEDKATLEKKSRGEENKAVSDDCGAEKQSSEDSQGEGRRV